MLLIELVDLLPINEDGNGIFESSVWMLLLIY